MISYSSLRCLFIVLIVLLLNSPPVYSQSSGSIWIRDFQAGSANINDQTVDQKALQLVDSLMQRDDIEVTFLGGADATNWRLFGRKVKHQIADTWDQAKKLERASALRQKYNRGQIGTTDEPIRGVKVVWRRKRPDIFQLQKMLDVTKNQVDSLAAALDSLKGETQYTTNYQPILVSSGIRAVEPGYHSMQEATVISDWEVKTGFMVWSAGGPYDLSAPYVGLALKRMDWALEFQGGFSPWSEYSTTSSRGDAFLLGSLHLFPRSWCQIKTGVFSGWEFLTKSDVWTMKIMGFTAGPKLQFKFFETYFGYTFGKLSSLTEERWRSGVLITTNFHLKLN